MGKVICFGEALIDFLQFNVQPSGPLSLNNYCQYPGGAPANASVAVSKLGGQALFLGQVGDDVFGCFLENALHTYQVDTQYLFKHPTAKTALAFVMLDDDGERSFSFYRDQSADVLFTPAQIPENIFQAEDFVHFCSNTLTTVDITQTTQAIINLAKKEKLVVSFDVNLRHNLWPQEQADITLVNKFVNQADVLKFSKSELTYLAGGNEDNYIETLLANGCQLLLVTNDGEAIQYFSQFHRGIVLPPKVNVIDTTAGGDAFSGGLLFQLSQSENWQDILQNSKKLKALVQFSVACGAHTVARAGAFPALPEYADVSDTSYL
jgi:fructokinase